MHPKVCQCWENPRKNRPLAAAPVTQLLHSLFITFYNLLLLWLHPVGDEAVRRAKGTDSPFLSHCPEGPLDVSLGPCDWSMYTNGPSPGVCSPRLGRGRTWLGLGSDSGGHGLGQLARHVEELVEEIPGAQQDPGSPALVEVDLEHPDAALG